MQLPKAENDYYWRLTLRDGREVDIPPKYVDIVKRKMDDREPIHTTSGSIPFSSIDSFDRTSRRFTDTALLEGAAQAFKEPLFTESGGVAARWVKKVVSQHEYDRKYSKSPQYRRLQDNDGMVVIAFVIPTHLFNKSLMEYCTEEEERTLERR